MMVWDGGYFEIIVGVGEMASLTQPPTIPAATIPVTTTTETRNNPVVTPASNRRTCSLPLLPSPAISTAT